MKTASFPLLRIKGDANVRYPFPCPGCLNFWTFCPHVEAEGLLMQSQDQTPIAQTMCSYHENNNHHTNRVEAINKYRVTLSSTKANTDDTLAAVKEILLSAYRSKSVNA